jgi:nicotinamide-nucleotide amidase
VAISFLPPFGVKTVCLSRGTLQINVLGHNTHHHSRIKPGPEMVALVWSGETSIRTKGDRMSTLHMLVDEISSLLLAGKMTLATAESCTGGLLGHVLTNRPGSSEWYVGGVVAYANSLKTGLLSVSETLLVEQGAVSEGCVRAMAQSVCALTQTRCGVAVSGIAGPGGGTVDKPVGTVWIGWAHDERVRADRFLFTGSREEIKLQAVRAALEGFVKMVKEEE